MANYNDTYFTPAQASALAQGAFDAFNNALPCAQFFPTSYTGSDKVAWNLNTRNKMYEATYTAWNVPAPLDTEDFNAAVSYQKLLQIQTANRIDEEKIMLNRGMSEDWVKAQLEAKFMSFGKSIALRLEALRLSALVNAQYNIDDNDLKGDYDFARDASLTITLSSNKWGTQANDPVQDIRSWRKLIQAANGSAPTTLITTRKVLDAISGSEKLLSHVHNVVVSQPQPIYVDQMVATAFASVGITNIVVIDELYQKFADERMIDLPTRITSAIPEDTVLLAPSTAVGITAVGVNVEQSIADFGLQNTQGISAYVYDAGVDVVGPKAKAKLTAMPVLNQANSTLKATVL